MNIKGARGGAVTVVTNRIGDIFVVLFIVTVISQGADLMSTPTGSGLVCMLLFLAGVTKRAIMPYSIWLPEAIAAPTPVSSLVHSSTLVTAGVFLIIQTAQMALPTALIALGVTASFSLVASSLAALLSQDLKKVVALSTLSQLRLMMIALRLGMPVLAFFHLLTHALFKSCLFIRVGAVIHMSRGSQESRKVAIRLHN